MILQAFCGFFSTTHHLMGHQAMDFRSSPVSLTLEALLMANSSKKKTDPICRLMYSIAVVCELLLGCKTSDPGLLKEHIHTCTSRMTTAACASRVVGSLERVTMGYKVHRGWG